MENISKEVESNDIKIDKLNIDMAWGWIDFSAAAAETLSKTTSDLELLFELSLLLQPAKIEILQKSNIVALIIDNNFFIVFTPLY